MASAWPPPYSSLSAGTLRKYDCILISDPEQGGLLIEYMVIDAYAGFVTLVVWLEWTGRGPCAQTDLDEIFLDPKSRVKFTRYKPCAADLPGTGTGQDLPQERPPGKNS
jgi:hypothetical protein